MGTLSKFQKHVFDCICLYGYDTDVPISRLWVSVYGQNPPSHFTNRNMQQKLAPLFRRVNEKLSASKIVPGELKQTYRIVKR